MLPKNLWPLSTISSGENVLGASARAEPARAKGPAAAAAINCRRVTIVIAALLLISAVGSTLARVPPEFLARRRVAFRIGTFSNAIVNASLTLGGESAGRRAVAPATNAPLRRPLPVFP